MDLIIIDTASGIYWEIKRHVLGKQSKTRTKIKPNQTETREAMSDAK